jgi:pyrimidine-nucleoside phosphorylase
MTLGAGRETLNSEIDVTAGIYLHKKCGDYVRKGDVLATLENSSSMKLQKSVEVLKSAYEFSETVIVPPELILGRIE